VRVNAKHFWTRLYHTIYQEFLFFVAVYLPPQTDAGTKTALNELYKPIGKQTDYQDLYTDHALTNWQVSSLTFSTSP
jgi:hypothetical protein